MFEKFYDIVDNEKRIGLRLPAVSNPPYFYLFVCVRYYRILFEYLRFSISDLCCYSTLLRVISSRESHASLKVDQQYVYASSWAFDSSVLKIFILWIFVKKKKKKKKKGKERRREGKE